MQKRFTRCSTTFLLFLLILVSSRMSRSQTNTSSISGTVTDSSGALLPGANVKLSNTASGSTQVLQSSSKGEFAFEQLAPGTYSITVSATGFNEVVQKVELLISTPLKLNFGLSAGSSEVVNVETTLATLNTTDATLGKAFDSAQVQNLPYLANNVTYLLSLQPGVLALDSGAQTGGLNQDTRTGIVNGARQDQTNLTLDGVDNNDQIFGYAFNGALRSTRESVDEFRVTTTNANADAGRSSGAQVSLVTRSGTNTIHGSAYEYYRDPGTTSNNWFNKQAQLNSGQPNIAAKVLEHTFGGSLGLPIKHDKLFFFGAYEGFKQASDVLVSETVPSTLGGGGLITGNVSYQACPTSALCQNSSTYKTLTPADIATLDGRAGDSNCTSAGSTCYAPATNAASLAYFRSFPTANSNATGDGINTGTYNFTSPSPLSQITNIARIDYNASTRNTFFARGNLQQDNQATSLQFPGSPAGSNVFSNNKGIAGGWIWNINSHITNNVRYGFTRIDSATRGVNQAYVAFGAFSNQTASSSDSLFNVGTNDWEDEVTFVEGRHTIQGGLSLYLISNKQYFTGPLIANASVSPDLLATAGIANQGGSLDPGAYACANCGTVSTAFQNFYNNAIISNVGVIEEAQSGVEFSLKNSTLTPLPAGQVPTYNYKNFEQEYFIQDQWKVNERFTLTYGLRYVHLGTPYEANGQQIAPTIPLNTLIANRIAAANAGTGYTTPVSFAAAGSANGQPNFWNPQKLNFAPRVSFAYATPNNRSSVRGGFALAYDHFGQAIIDNYIDAPSSLFGLSQVNMSYFGEDINSNPRFSGYRDVPAVTASLPSSLPFAPPGAAFSFDSSINNVQKTPYAENFNLTVEHQLGHNFDFTASYVGRLGRHLIENLDTAQPTNVKDPVSGQTYYQAATAYDKLADQGVSPGAIPNSGYFQNLFPNFSFGGLTGAQAYYADLAANRGNETDPLFAADTDPTASAGGQSFRFFFPQTSSIYAQSTIGTSNYNALQLSVRQELPHGFIYDVNYTYAHSFDEGSDPERLGGGNAVINTFNIRQMYAPSDFDVRHNVTADYTLPLPFGKGSPFFNQSSWVDRIFGGFQLNGVVHYSTGFPFSAVASFLYGTNFATPSYMVQTGPIPTGGHRYVASEQSETALKGITSAQANANLRFAYAGETGQRNNFRADGYLSLDDGLAKSIRTWHEQQLRISAEVFNVLNTNRFNSLDESLGGNGQFPLQNDGASPNFGNYIGGPSALLVQPRQMQFSAKYTF